MVDGFEHLIQREHFTKGFFPRTLADPYKETEHWQTVIKKLYTYSLKTMPKVLVQNVERRGMPFYVVAYEIKKVDIIL